MRSQIAVWALFGCLLLATTACDRHYGVVTHNNADREAKRQAKREAKERLVAAQRAEYQELQGQFASMKLTIENDIATYNLSQPPEDPLNVSQDQRIAYARVLQTARDLKDQSAAAVANDRESFLYVKGSKKTSRFYNEFAEETIRKFEAMNGTAAESESGNP